jgi:hypothetical protein
MNFRTITAYVAVFVALSGTVAAQETTKEPAKEPTTVQSLIKQGFTIAGVTTNPSAGGAGLFLQNKDQVFFCFVAERPDSPAVVTRYCKPVQ